MHLPARLVYFVMAGANNLMRSTMFIVLSIYYVLVVHMNPFQLVLVGTVIETTYFLTGVPSGVLADLYSYRWSIVVGWLMVGACLLTEGLFPAVTVILAAEAVRGVGEAFVDGTGTAWLAGEVGEEAVGPLLVRGASMGQVTGVAGTLVGVLLATVRLNLPVVCGAVGMIAVALFLAATMPEHGVRPERAGGHWAGMRGIAGAGLGAVRGSRILLLLLAAELFSGAASEGFDRLWEAHLILDVRFPGLGHLKPVVWFGILSLFGGVIGWTVITPLRRRLDSVLASSARTARVLMALTAVRLLMVLAFALARPFGLVVAALLTKGASEAVADPLYNAWLVRHTPAGVRATVLSLCNQSNAVGQIAGGPGVGAIGTAFSIRAALVTSALLLTPALGVYARTADEPEVALTPVGETP